MAYTALYRKWRPRVFDDVKGQGPIMTTLKNQVRSGRIGHAYLFCGSRGTGKTTAARILARAINCENPQDGEPCCECESCRAIEAGSSMNVFEIDAASNNGVDNVREILDEMRYPPAVGRYRVYIIDEVHMFSTPAFNALLKSLEEPPEYVVFILATTEPHKLPATILSRCQQYDFHRIGTEVIFDRLRTVCAQEGFCIEDRALKYIARKADGGFRDALSLLDQVTAAAGTEEISFDRTLELLGAVDTEIFSRFFRLILQRDIPALLLLTEQISMSGKDLSQFTQDLVWYLRDVLLKQAAPDMRELLEVSDDDLARLAEDAASVGTDALMRLIRQYSALHETMRQTVSKRAVFEVGVIRSAMPEAEQSLDAVNERLAALERKLAGGVIPLAAAPAAKNAAPQPVPEEERIPLTDEAPWPDWPEDFASAPVSRPEPVRQPAPMPVQKPVLADPGIRAELPAQRRPAAQGRPAPAQGGQPAAGSTAFPELVRLVPRLDPSQRPYFRDSSGGPGADGGYTVLFADEDAMDMAEIYGAKQMLASLLKEACGREVAVTFRAKKDGAGSADSVDDDIRSVFHFEITETL